MEFVWKTNLTKYIKRFLQVLKNLENIWWNEMGGGGGHKIQFHIKIQFAILLRRVAEVKRRKDKQIVA